MYGEFQEHIFLCDPCKTPLSNVCFTLRPRLPTHIYIGFPNLWGGGGVSCGISKSCISGKVLGLGAPDAIHTVNLSVPVSYLTLYKHI